MPAAKRKNLRMAAIGRKGGSVSTPAKHAAVAENGKLGGRPAKFAPGDRVKVNGLAPSDYRGRVGAITQKGPGRAEYSVAFLDEPRHGFLMSWWLDAAR